MKHEIYGGNKASYEVTETQNGWIELRVHHMNRSVRQVLRRCRDNPSDLLRRRWQGARAAYWMGQVITDFRPYFEQNRVRILLGAGIAPNSTRSRDTLRTATGARGISSEAVPRGAAFIGTHKGNRVTSPMGRFCHWMGGIVGTALGMRATETAPKASQGQAIVGAEVLHSEGALSMRSGLESIVRPKRLWSRTEVLNVRNCPVPDTRGLYGWYFRSLPDPRISAARCVCQNGCYLLYVGIAPQDEQSGTSLRSRIIDHYRNWTTLRITLGSLLATELGLTPRNDNLQWDREDKLSAWMSENAFVVWVEHPEPWVIEPEIIGKLDLPLNVQHNRGHPFRLVVKAARKRQKDIALRL